MNQHDETPNGPTQVGHPIAVVAERTGLSRDVLRVWERRYGTVEPTRSPGGQRVYTDEDVRRFKLLAAATRHGRSIGAVAGLSTQQLTELVASDDAAAADAPARARASGDPSIDAADLDAADLDAAVDEALEHTTALDSAKVDRVLRRTLARHGAPVFIESFVSTLMSRIGDDWAAGKLTVAHEHLTSAAALTILLETLRALPATAAARRAVVATPSGEYHAVGAALAAVAAALDGWTVIYLGADVPAADIVEAARARDADLVALSCVFVERPAVLASEIETIRAALPPSTHLIVGGAAAARLPARQGAMICTSIRDFRRALATVSAS